MLRKLYCFLFACFLLGVPAFAQTKKEGELTVLRRRTWTFKNANCAARKTCGLKWVKYTVEDYKVVIDGSDENYGTRFFAQYETDSLASIEQYAFVQFKKGCTYYSQLKDGTVVIPYGDTTPQFGKNQENKFIRWTIDSDSDDPVYSSTLGRHSRFDHYRWNTVRGSVAEETEKHYRDGPPPYPEAYIIDRPSAAFMQNGVAKNSSFHFKACIYRMRDVPLHTASDNLHFAKPISCYSWDTSFIYNHATEKFERHTEIVPACKE